MAFLGFHHIPTFFNNFGQGGGGLFGSSDHRTDFIEAGYKPAFGYIQDSTDAAKSLLRKAYEGQFRARAAGYTGGQDEAQRSYGAQIASQGLSPDVAARQLLEQRISHLTDLAGARGEAEFGFNSDLAKLEKGTGSELAGLSQDELTAKINYLTASKAADATKQAGIVGGIGSLVGGIIGGIHSDPRLKKNVVQVGMIRFGRMAIPVYHYEYKAKECPGVFCGVMSTDVRDIPGVVSVSPSGFDQVDYLRLRELTGFEFKRVGPSRSRRSKLGAA